MMRVQADGKMTSITFLSSVHAGIPGNGTGLLAAMQAAHLLPDVITHNATISAWRAQQWHQAQPWHQAALLLLKVITYSAATGAREKAQQWRQTGCRHLQRCHQRV